jgi:uncharacterized protein
MEPRLSLITLGYADFDRAMRFYRDGLGFPLSPASQGDVAFFRTGGVVLALYPRDKLAADAGVPDDGIARFGGVALAHNVRSRSEVDDVLADAASAGGVVTAPARETSYGGYAGYFTDPDGHVWEIAFNPGFPLGPDGSLTVPDLRG